MVFFFPAAHGGGFFSSSPRWWCLSQQPTVAVDPRAATPRRRGQLALGGEARDAAAARDAYGAL